MVWYRIYLTNDEVTADEQGKLQEQFAALWTAALAPKHAAMFAVGHPPEGCSLYFSPDAVSFAAALIRFKGWYFL